MKKITRRDFLKSAAVGAAGLSAANIMGTGTLAAEDAPTFADTVAWDGQYDVIVVGFGGAGGMAAIGAAKKGASVLLIDKAPEGHEGGNTRYCMQAFLGSSDYETSLAYYKAMACSFYYDQEPLETFIQGLVDQKDKFEEIFGFAPASYNTDRQSCEYPHLTGGVTALHGMNAMGTSSDASLWKLIRRTVTEDYAGRVDVWYSAPAEELIQDSESRTVVGVQINKQGESVRIRANNGVVMACGGFENSRLMTECYLGMTNVVALGSLYNTGDGIPMVAACGVDIRNTFNYSGYGNLGGLCWIPDEGTQAEMLLDNNFGTGSCFVAGGNGQRYVNENAQKSGHATREDCHGRLAYCGEWRYPIHPHDNHYVFDQAQYDDLEAAGSLTDKARKHMIQADSVEALCEAAGGVMDAQVLRETIRKYNLCIELGEDLQCNRPVESMRPFNDQGRIYAIPMRILMMNTQGGGRRNGNLELVDRDYAAIPHLYGAGEFGGVVANYYNGAGNLAEAVATGRIAGENAAAPKEALPPLSTGAHRVQSNMVYTIDGDYVRNPAKTFALGENEYLGQSDGGMGGLMSLSVKVADGKIEAISFLDITETIGVCDRAVAQIPAAIIEKQSVDVDSIAGATLTSRAIKEAVADALSKLG